jgi:AraC-like DNA-binding protein
VSQALALGPASDVSIRVVRSLIQALEERGAATGPLLSALGIDVQALESPELRLPGVSWCPAIEAALEATDDPAFGLHWAERVTDLLSHTATLGDAISHFRWLLSDSFRFSVSEQDGHVYVELPERPGDTPRVRRFVAELIVAGLFRLVRAFAPDARLHSASFSYPEPSYASEYLGLFGECVRFSQPVSGVSFAGLQLSAAADGARRPRGRYAERVRELLIQHNGPRHVSMQEVARLLGLAERTLRRRLTEEGTSYDAIACAVLSSIAASYLLDRRRTIQETAFELGFTDRASFHRAFKRWTGTTPASFRKIRLTAT